MLIINQDALTILRQMPEAIVDMIITSPPYNIGIEYSNNKDSLSHQEYLDWLFIIWLECYRVLKHGGRICVNIGENKREGVRIPYHVSITQQLAGLDLLYRGTVIWAKNNAANRCAWGSWMSPRNPHIVPQHEYLILFSKTCYDHPGEIATIRPVEFMDASKSIWPILPESHTRIGHPAPFPVKLVDKLLKFYTFESDLILDPFAGSGTVGIAAHSLKRDFVLIDNSEEYCQLMQQRFMSTYCLHLDISKEYPIE